jgi:methylmalonyl-CoA mutase cobalamin-binding domain/chain
MGHIKVIIGGVIPPDDVKKLTALGINAVFTPGAMRDKILKEIDDLFD